jgi:hypothetical protein
MPEEPQPTIDPKNRAEMVETAIKIFVAQTEGQPYIVRKQATVVMGAIRGHKFDPADMQETPEHVLIACRNCGQVVKALVNGTNVVGRAVENDCPSAPWKQPA